jgi:hypothetical protein
MRSSLKSGQAPHVVGKALAEISIDNPETLSILRNFIKPACNKSGSAGSHFSTLRTKVTDADVLISSLQDLGITVRTDAEVRGYNGQRVRADVVAVLEGEYDIGWSRNSNGSFDLITDLRGLAKKYQNQTDLINCIMIWVYPAKKAWKDRRRI